MGFQQARLALCLEGWLHTLDAQQSDLDEGDGRAGGVAGLSRHLE